MFGPIHENVSQNDQYSQWSSCLDFIAEIRDYTYDPRIGYWSSDFPAFFREKQPYRISNMRHGLITVPEYDKSETRNDMRYISGWGTGMGVDYNNEIGVVTNIAPYSCYYKPDAESGVQRELIQRQYVGSVPELGKSEKSSFLDFILTII